MIVGAGALGVITGYHLHLAGADVTFFVRENRLVALGAVQNLYCYDDGMLKIFSGYRTASNFPMLATLARITKKARLLALGVPIANRPDPVRIAEELSMIDVIPGRHLEMGLIKASPFELAMSNQIPASPRPRRTA